MNSLELAIRRYKQIVPKSLDRFDGTRLETLKVWVQTELRACLEDYVELPSFREAATWPITNLRVNAGTTERELVDLAEAEIAALGRQLSPIISKSRVEVGTDKMPASSDAADPSIVVLRSGSDSLEVAAPLRSGDSGLFENQLLALAENGVELVNTDDYFWPTQRYEQNSDGSFIQHGEFIVSLNADLIVPGNFIVRCMMKRFRNCLAMLSHCVNSHLEGVAIPSQQGTEAYVRWHNIQNIRTQLETAFESGVDMRLRDACVALTQVYAVEHPSPGISWLDSATEASQSKLNSLRGLIHSQSGPAYLERIVSALHILDRLDLGDSTELPLTKAIAGGGLVIVKSARRIIWEGVEVPQIPDKQFDLLAALAKKARRRGYVNASEIYDEPVSRGALSNLIMRLKQSLPQSLRKLVISSEGSGGYQIELDSHRIDIFD